MKLSEAIRRGHPLIGETKAIFLANGCGCALGAAFVGLGYKEEQRFGGDIFHDTLHETIARECGVSEALLLRVSHMHHSGQMTRLQLADWVEREYESKLPQHKREFDADYTRRVITEITNGAHHEASQKVAG